MRLELMLLLLLPPHFPLRLLLLLPLLLLLLLRILLWDFLLSFLEACTSGARLNGVEYMRVGIACSTRLDSRPPTRHVVNKYTYCKQYPQHQLR